MSSVVGGLPRTRQASSWRHWLARARLERLAVGAALLAATVALLATSPVNGDFWWQDAPRHALNGAFVRDFVAAMPWRHPVGWAMNYYIHYPSLTILFYPPLFYAVEALFYAVFGVSHFAAQCAVSPFVLMLGVACYRLSRLFLPRWSALGVALLMMGAPETALWGRQVMLDVPLQATLAASVLCFVSYLRKDRSGWLYGAAVLFVAALYIKLTAIYIVPPMLLALFMARGRAALRDRRLILTAILGLIAAVPAILLTLRFGAVNVENVTGSAGSNLSLGNPLAWAFYARAMPAQLGIVTTVLALIGAGALVWRRAVQPGAAAGRPAWLSALMLSWFGVGYLFFSAIAVRELRHDLSILFPVALCAALGLHRLLAPRLAQGAVLALGILTLAYSLVFLPVPTIRGYRQIADYVAANLPRDGVVVYSGYRDGNFVFDMRAHAERRDVTILRADKLLLRMAVFRDWGVRQTTQDQQQIAAMLRKDGVAMIVAQSGFWNDQRQMRRFAEVAHSKDFREVARFDISGDLSTNDGNPALGHNTVEIFRPTYAVMPPQGDIDIDMPFIGTRFHGAAGAGRAAR